ncbi:bifunctional diguanylate cyclase/phosphodiesterase [Marinospirillum perlucidum]|uniref:bifunctional diguanylate cyclase/phosphodiesterase n=1 Tax=Marinospirillum perlucidum TaxID=1982602 RepID=UPI00138FDA84|nr:EAL domain-containing protein [Marinospirillum perlucidum]
MAKRTLQLSTGILLLALTYLLAGISVSGSGIHSQILPFWIPAGIALAAGIQLGYRYLPGAGLGSLLFNLLHPTGWQLDALTPELFLTAFIVAVGVTLQAGVGTWLVINKVGNPLALKGENQVLKFIVVVGFGVSLINACLGAPAVYWLSPQEGSAGLLTDWLTWWLGDSFGVLLVTPMILAILTPRHEKTTTRLYRRVILLFAGALFSILTANHIYLLQVDKQLQSNFSRDLDIFHANLNRIYQQNLADLRSLESLFIQNRGLSPGNFHQVTQEIFARNASVRAYSWDPVIDQENREHFETLTRELLDYPSYAVYGESLQPEDPLIPVQFVEPLESNQAALGFNLLSLEDRRRWVLQARETGRALATEILNLTQAPDEPGLLILQPVFLNAESTSSSVLTSQKQLAGFMVGVFTVNQMLESALRLSDLHGVQVKIWESGSEEAFYQSSQQRLTPLYQSGFSFTFAQQEWYLEVTGGQTYKALNPGVNLLQFQSLLVLVSALISTVILGMHNRETSLAYRVREQTRNLAFQAEHDPLTGLPNRLRLEQELDLSFHQDQSRLALMFIGLDRFKMINDSLGHLTGDSLLIELAARWMQEFASSAELYRMGGDEFILLHHLTEQENKTSSLALAERLLKITAEPIQAAGMQLQITASVGIAFSSVNSRDANTLIRNADTALHQAKATGKNRYQVYQSSQTELAQQYFELEQDLRQALNTRQLTLFYQPQHRLDDLSLCGFEALVRWQHPTQGLIPPDQFIALAEETQLIVPLGWQVIDMACQQIALWLEDGIQVPCVAINISPQQLLQSDFIDQLNTIVDAYDLSRKYLELEITETLLHQDPDFAFKQLKSLRLAGYRLALDDFGTGYSSFDRLKYMPLDRLKIDRSFVRDIDKNPKDEAIILAIIGLGKSLEIEVLAEGVETFKQQNFLIQHGCDSVQGYLHGRPQPSSKLFLQV